MTNERPPRVKRGLDRVEVLRKKSEEFLKDHPDAASSLAAAQNKDNGPRERIFGIIAAALHSLGAAASVRKTLERQYDFSHLPVNTDTYNFREEQLGSGYWSEVYMLEPKEERLPTLVLKIEFPLKKHPADDLVTVAHHYREEYRFLQDAYKEIPGCIPDSNYFVTKSPRTGQPAIAILQTYAGHNSFDAMSSENIERIRALMDAEPEFRTQFETFRRITLALAAEGKAPDVSGGDNVLIVESEGKHSIRIVDHHGIDADNAVVQAGQQRILARLATI